MEDQNPTNDVRIGIFLLLGVIIIATTIVVCFYIYKSNGGQIR